jgi:DNA-binding Lrp family transcriptional regulator
MTGIDERARVLLDWLAGIGAAALAEIADAAGLSAPATAARLRRLESERLVVSVRLLHGQPALYAITRGGLRAVGRNELAPVRVSNSGFLHLLECARVARSLECVLAGSHTVHSERELRAWERAAGRPLVSAELGFSVAAGADVHRPDLVCLPVGSGAALLPLAVEVELTVKAPARLRAIVRGWARSRRVAGVVYYAAPAPLRALERAVLEESAAPLVQVLPLAAAARLPAAFADPRSTSPIPRAP